MVVDQPARAEVVFGDDDPQAVEAE